MPKSSWLILFVALLLSYGRAKAQTIEPVANQPSPEAYDLLKDSKGYLWVGHDLGISRYDGSAFVNLHSPEQNSLSVSDLVEDKQGRIWCHNFSGQIFYIENLQMHLLAQYNYKEEQGFPKITICGDELIATSVKGIFVYNLVTGKARYHLIQNGTGSLTKVGNKVVCYGPSGFFCYEKDRPVLHLATNFSFPGKLNGILQNNCLNDTLFFVINPIGSYYKLTLQNDLLKLQSVNKTASFINTVSVHNNKVWINTKELSYTTDGTEQIRGMNLSDVILDSQGSRWMTSLKKGLCVQHLNFEIKNLGDSLFITGNDARTVHVANNKLYLGTVSGKLYRQVSPASFKYVLSTPKQTGAIERIASLDSSGLLLATSVGLYYYNEKTRLLRQLPLSVVVKDVAVHNQKVYLATTGGIIIFTFEQLNHSQRVAEPDGFQKITRCRSIAFCHDSLIAAYNDGVYVLYKNTIRPLLYNNLPIYASRIRNIGGKILIGTFNQGLLILHHNTITNINEKHGLASNIIKDIKTYNGSTWLIYTDQFQKLDPSLTSVEEFSSPFSKTSSMTDLAVLDHTLYLITGAGVYSQVIQKTSVNLSTSTYIDEVTVGGKEVAAGKPLQHDQNFLQFRVSTPFFPPGSNILYQYRIKTESDSTWQWGAPEQSTFTLAALKPGDYDFEIVAANESRKLVSVPAVYHFTINPPWYQHWLFRVGLFLAVAALGFYLVRLYYLSRLRKQRLEYEKMLAIQAERQRISSEIHDDIGAGLSAVRLLTELTKNKLPENESKLEVGKIHASLSELSHKMREVIWSLNTDNDYLENLLYYIRRQALLLFENSPIHLKISFPATDIPDIIIKGEKRRHIYLAVKEALHNCLKHSEAQNCHLSMSLEAGALHITIADDGKGFAASSSEQSGYGLAGMQKRMKQISGAFVVDTTTRTIVQFVIPLNEHHA